MKRFSRDAAQDVWDCGRSTGSVILELALVLPLFLFGVFGAIEATRLMRIAQLTNVLSYQMGNVSFRKCALLRKQDGTPDTGRIAKCLQDSLGSNTATGVGIYSFILGPLHIDPADVFATVAIYQRSGGNTLRLASHQFGQLSEHSRIPTLDSTFNGILQDGPAGEPAQPQVVVSEVILQYRPFVFEVAGVGHLFPPVHYYDATIF